MIDIVETGKLSLVSISANKTRSFLTMLGVIIGVAAVILLVSIGAGLQSFITDQFESLGKNVLYVLPGKVGGGGGGGAPAFTASKLSDREISAIEKIPTVKAVTGGYQTSTTARRGKESIYTEVNGSFSNITEIRNLDLEKGRSFTESEFNGNQAVAVLGYRVKDELFGQRDPIGKAFLLGGKSYTVIGYRKESGGLGNLSADNEIIVPSSTLKLQFNLDKYAYLVAASQDDVDPQVASRQIERAVSRYLDEDDFTVSSQDQLLGTINQILGVLTAALGGIAAISLLVGGVGIMNIMLVSVTERTREIGLRKAVGARPQDLLAQFLIEAIIVSVSGGIIGILVGVGGSLLIDRYLITTQVTLWSIFTALGVSTATGIIFGLAPAAKAAKKDPIDALRYE